MTSSQHSSRAQSPRFPRRPLSGNPVNKRQSGEYSGPGRTPLISPPVMRAVVGVDRTSF